MSSTVTAWCGFANRDEPNPERKARAWASSRARVAGSEEAVLDSDSMTGTTYSSNSCRANLAEEMKEVRRSTKNGLRTRINSCYPEYIKVQIITHSSPRKNSAVMARCSRDKLVDSTPPYNSLSRTVPSADRVEALCKYSAQKPRTTH